MAAAATSVKKTMTNEHKRQLEWSKDDVVDNMSTASIKNFLFSKLILEEHQIEEIEQNNHATRDEEAEGIINAVMLQNDDAYELLLEALRESNQAHVAEIILNAKKPEDTTDSVTATYKVEDAILMTKEHKKQLREATMEVVENMDPAPVFLKMVSKGFLSTRSVDRIKKNGLATKYQQVTNLMRGMPQRYDQAFYALIDSLNETEQAHVAAIIESKGEAAKMNALANAPSPPSDIVAGPSTAASYEEPMQL